jgi:hypothetical protein
VAQNRREKGVNMTRTGVLLLSVASAWGCQRDAFERAGSGETGGAAIWQAGGPAANGGSKAAGGRSPVVQDESAGSDGVGGQAGSRSGTGGVQDCGVHALLGPSLSVSGLNWSPGDEPHDARAVVEQSAELPIGTLAD